MCGLEDSPVTATRWTEVVLVMFRTDNCNLKDGWSLVSKHLESHFKLVQYTLLSQDYIDNLGWISVETKHAIKE